MKVGVVVFPGSNCDHDLYHVVGKILGFEAVYLWHKDADLKGCDAVVIPGGFSYGDYLRCGAIAKFSPVMKEVQRFAQEGRPLLGICNGFQILTEAGLLPGALIRNRSLKFLCDYTNIRVDSAETPFTRRAGKGSVLKIPIAHGEGNYFIDAEGLKKLEGEGQVVFRYVDAQGEASEAANPNGSLNNIAGVCNARRNVVGLMPHPERVSEALLGCEDGKRIFESLLAS
ncbi:phosphoribosylformylglycinamidine synthase subunit PurQ [Deltaproteobacteria bacterium PRO3]|nr:phosphoribosylformylglycinamidine synthase subunit PurQ [Deltaproteobacteria bacterium PRO3]